MWCTFILWCGCMHLANEGVLQCGLPRRPPVCRMKDVAYRVCDELREDRKLFHVPTFLAGPAAGMREWLSMRLPMHMMTRDLVFTKSSLAEGTIDKVESGNAKGFKDLHLKPRTCLDGVAIDHIRHWRKGGYDLGTNEPDRA